MLLTDKNVYCTDESFIDTYALTSGEFIVKNEISTLTLASLMSEIKDKFGIEIQINVPDQKEMKNMTETTGMTEDYIIDMMKNAVMEECLYQLIFKEFKNIQND